MFIELKDEVANGVEKQVAILIVYYLFNFDFAY
jgi:hypothetical protein